MKKIQKKRVEDIIKLFRQAHDEIKKAVKEKRSAMAIELLSQCQEGAIQLGNIIEEVEGDELTVVRVLESYCEFLFWIYAQLQKNFFPESEMLYKDLEKFLEQIESGIEEDVKVCKEVVFLPYKAAMWDSLESVWRAADEDPNCDTYVIPIPYYDMNSDGSFGAMHYEADLYPDYVPITSYNAFDFSLHRPDMIFFHYPYDDTNFVTSVHPFFYSKNLKQYTDKLVYIPYFVLGEPDLHDDEAISNIEHFCKVPGVYNADRVIVQSENMRIVYIKVLTDLVGEHTRPYWETKILGLGSPKYDKVSNIGEKEFVVPDQWKRNLYRADGSRKTVILFNTSVSAMHKQGDQMIKKMRHVFRIMKTRRENITLLWRPHPLIWATIHSMCPQLWDDYKELVEEYKSEGWGIYDDSADLERAIALCDGYYGDYSSLVQLCQKAGKATMIQNLSILDDNGGKLLV